LKYSSFDEDEIEEGDEFAQSADLILENFKESVINSNIGEPAPKEQLMLEQFSQVDDQPLL